VDALARRVEAAARTVNLSDSHPLAAKRRDILVLQAKGLAALARGHNAEGVAALRKAAQVEQNMEVPYGPPLVEKPSFELLGDELAALDRNGEAAEAYAAALKLAPGRRLSLAGYEHASRVRRDGVATASATPHQH
jgi:tetratricopeptide (TPR) repeat protein